jgi:hypothetical protein
MQSSNQQPSVAVDTLAVAQAYQDQLIVKRLPEWVTRLSEAEFTLFSDALRSLLDCEQKLSAAFARISNIDVFAKPLLQQALKAHGNLDPGAMYFRRWYVYEANTVSYLAGRVLVPNSDYYDLPLLEAALDNFPESECRQQPRRNAVVDGKGVRQGGLSALTFARLCRALDMGKQYQDHLDSILLAGTGAHSVKTLLAQFLRSSMLADALQAKAQGGLSEAELQRVIGLCRDDKLGSLEGAPVHARQLKIFGCPVQRSWCWMSSMRDGSSIPASGYWCMSRVIRRVPGVPMTISRITRAMCLANGCATRTTVDSSAALCAVATAIGHLPR